MNNSKIWKISLGSSSLSGLKSILVRGRPVEMPYIYCRALPLFN